MSEPTSADWFAQADPELALAHTSYQGGNMGRARVGSRRAAGMALKGWLQALADRGEAPSADYGRSFMHHLNALADDNQIEDLAVREAAWRLAARGRPEAGFAVPVPEPLTPMEDAALIMSWCKAQLQH